MQVISVKIIDFYGTFAGILQFTLKVEVVCGEKHGLSIVDLCVTAVSNFAGIL